MPEKSFEERVKDAFWSVVLEEPIKKLCWVVLFGVLLFMYYLFSSGNFWSIVAFGFSLASIVFVIILGVAVVLNIGNYNALKAIQMNLVIMNLCY
jgi:hypothetical protein